jgi:hypothetical protein
MYYDSRHCSHHLSFFFCDGIIAKISLFEKFFGFYKRWGKERKVKNEKLKTRNQNPNTQIYK